MIYNGRVKPTRHARRPGHAGARGRILAIKWGMNPNSSSLGVDVTFLLVGATALAMVTPVIGALLRWRKPVTVPPTDDKSDPA